MSAAHEGMADAIVLVERASKALGDPKGECQRDPLDRAGLRAAIIYLEEAESTIAAARVNLLAEVRP